MDDVDQVIEREDHTKGGEERRGDYSHSNRMNDPGANVHRKDTKYSKQLIR